MEYGGDELLLLKKEVSHELRRELKEMFFIEWMKHESLTPRRRAPAAGGTSSAETENAVLEVSLETLGKLLEENMAKVRQDLRQLTQKIECAEVVGRIGGEHRGGHPAISLSVPLPFLPPVGHRSIPSPLQLDHVNSPGETNSNLHLNLPSSSSKGGKRNMSIVLPSEILLNSLELSQEPPPASKSAREHSAASARRAFSCDQLEESGTLSESLTFEEDDDDDEEILEDEANNPMESSCLLDQQEAEDEVVTLNVGGRTFQTYRDTLLRMPGSLLGRWVTSEHYAKEKKENASRSRSRDIFFDRNTTAFEAILDCYRTGLLLKPPELHEEIWKIELGYWDVTVVKEKKRDKRDKTVKRKTKKKRASTKDKVDISTPVSPPGGRSWEESDLPRTKKERNRLSALVRGRPASLKDVSLKVKETRKDNRTMSTIDLPTHSETKKKKEKYIITTAPNIDLGVNDNSAWSKKKNRRSGSAYDLGLQAEKPEKQSKKEKRELSNRSLT